MTDNERFCRVLIVFFLFFYPTFLIFFKFKKFFCLQIIASIMCSGVRELEFGSVHVMRTGARKMADLKLADLKMKDQIVRKIG